MKTRRIRLGPHGQTSGGNPRHFAIIANRSGLKVPSVSMKVTRAPSPAATTAAWNASWVLPEVLAP